MCLIRLCISFSIFLAFCIWHCSVKTFQKYILCSLSFTFPICCINISQQESIVLIYMRLNGIMFYCGIMLTPMYFSSSFHLLMFYSLANMYANHSWVYTKLNTIWNQIFFFRWKASSIRLFKKEFRDSSWFSSLGRSQCSLRNKHR